MLNQDQSLDTTEGADVFQKERTIALNDPVFSDSLIRGARFAG
jgi:hypothetical protein